MQNIRVMSADIRQQFLEILCFSRITINSVCFFQISLSLSFPRTNKEQPMDTTPLHPYYPRTLELGHYVPNRIPMMTLLGIVGSAFTAIVAISFLSARLLKNRSAFDSGRFSWFIMCALMHCLFEGYWLSHHETIAGQSDLLAELWKEYAYSDSRYVSSDAVVVALETITIVCIYT